MKSLLWDIDYRCNLHCIHCYNEQSERNKKSTLLNNFSIDFILDRIIELGVEHLHLLGGEPLLYSGIIELIQKAKQRNLKVSVNTNGLLLSKQTVMELISANLDQITVSLDGENARDNDIIRGENTFKIVTEKIRSMVEIVADSKSKLLIQIASVVTKENIDKIYRMPILVNMLGVRYLDIMPIHYQGNGLKNKNALEISEEEYKSIIPKVLYYSYLYNVYTQIDCNSAYLDEICKKMGFARNTNSMFDVCQGGKEFLYMSAEGDLFPCGPMSFSNKWQHYISLLDDNVKEEIEKIHMYMRSLTKCNDEEAQLCIKCPISM